MPNLTTRDWVAANLSQASKLGERMAKRNQGTMTLSVTPKSQSAADGFNKADGIEYFAMLQMKAPFFRCDRKQANLSISACSTMWNAAQEATGRDAERLEVCRACSIGAAHAGKRVIARSKLYGAAICPRCRRGAIRMINNTRCISCYNREREVLAGRNAKGGVPSKLRKLYPIEITYAVDGVPRRYKSDRAVDVIEPMIDVLRKTKGDIVFSFSSKPMFQQIGIV